MTEDTTPDNVSPSANTPQSVNDKKNPKVIIGIVVVVILGFFMFSGGEDTEQALANLDALIEQNETITLGFATGDIDKAFVSEVEAFVAGFESEAKAHIKLAKGVDVDDEVEMKDFIARHDKISELLVHKDECRSSRIEDMVDHLDDLDVRNSQIEDIEELYLETCEISRTLDSVELERDTETIEVASEYAELDSAVIPDGTTFIAQRPTNGVLETVTLIVDDKERDTVEVVTLEPLIGKKVTGTGDRASIKASVLPILNAIAALWTSQDFNEESILEYLEDSVTGKNSEDEKAGMPMMVTSEMVASDNVSDIVDQYESVLFNWKRFENIEVLSDEVVFQDVSNSYRTTELGSTQHPFVMNVPIKMENVDDDKSTVIPFYYYSETDSWGAGLGTLQAFFNAAGVQDIPASFSVTKVIYEESDTCTSNWRFDREEGVEITYMSLMGIADFYINAGNSGPTQLFVKAEGKDTVSEMSGGRYGKFHSNFTPAVIKHLNEQKNLSVTIKEFNNQTCKVKPDIEVTFFAENEVEEAE